MAINDPTPAQLRAFVAVAERLHFRAAAASIGVSQPSLSQSLAVLESLVGTRLVERTTRRVLLTAAGERLLPRARAVLEALDAFTEAAGTAHEPLTGGLRLGVIPTVAPYLLPRALATLHRFAPELEPRVREDQTSRLVEALREGSLDVALLALPVAEPGLVAVPLYAEDFVVLVPPGHGWSGREDLPAEALREAKPLLLLDEGHCLRDQALEVCRAAGADDAGDDAGTRAASLATVVQLVHAGLGSTLLPATALAVETRRGACGVARFGAAPGRTIGLVHRASSTRAEEFADLAALLRRAVVDGRLEADVEGPVWGRPAA